MTPQIALVFAIVIVAAILLITERLRSDVVALLTLVALALTRLVTAQEAFAGFSRSAVITILSIFIITEALERTGVTRVIGDRLLGDREMPSCRGTDHRSLITDHHSPGCPAPWCHSAPVPKN